MIAISRIIICDGAFYCLPKSSNKIFSPLHLADHEEFCFVFSIVQFSSALTRCFKMVIFPLSWSPLVALSKDVPMPPKAKCIALATRQERKMVLNEFWTHNRQNKIKINIFLFSFPCARVLWLASNSVETVLWPIFQLQMFVTFKSN